MATAPLSPFVHQLLRAVFSSIAACTPRGVRLRAYRYLEAATTPMGDLLEEMRGKKVILAGIGFGTHLPPGRPGDSNNAIAGLIHEWHPHFGDATVVAQWDVAAALAATTPADYTIGTMGEPHIESGRFVDELAEIAHRTRTDFIILFGQIHHAGRVAPMLARRYFRVFVPQCCRKIPFDHSPQNIQWWCVEKHFWQWEALARLRERLKRV